MPSFINAVERLYGWESRLGVHTPISGLMRVVIPLGRGLLGTSIIHGFQWRLMRWLDRIRGVIII
jgi:hypothetical protein